MLLLYSYLCMPANDFIRSPEVLARFPELKALVEARML